MSPGNEPTFALQGETFVPRTRFDLTQPVEVGFFDTTPYERNPPGFAGAWTAFPFFESGTVVVSSMNEGLFVLRPRMQELVP